VFRIKQYAFITITERRGAITGARKAVAPVARRTMETAEENECSQLAHIECRRTCQPFHAPKRNIVEAIV
jgi:hypothetical protein